MRDMARKSSSARQTQVSNGAGSGAGDTLATSVYDRMRHDILRGALGPGEKLRAEYLRERCPIPAMADPGSSPRHVATQGALFHNFRRITKKSIIR